MKTKKLKKQIKELTKRIEKLEQPPRVNTIGFRYTEQDE